MLLTKIGTLDMTANSPDEKDLVILLAQGNKEAFEKLYYSYSTRLYGYIIKLVKSESFAIEILQDSFIKVWSHRQQIDPRQSFCAYLFRIVENTVFDFFRKVANDKKLQAVLIQKASGEYTHVEESVLAKEDFELLHEAMDALPPKRRQTFEMVKLEGRSYAEVSRLLHISPSTINDHIVKATKFIHDYLDGYQVMTMAILFFLFIP